ncbi:ABC transporter permease [Candidatus Cytomitobacter indipagum]|uniref:ABC transporter permease n=1 Tax=Candidatus Cytomitobacter indipagum TaxID=2601575 RepID=A0A5C0UE98_9PROT|nr:ABC transporter permease [Candidatus Cytomitobacter indipagum]QEK38030.1 ABC transporter permease [Candidatus Cytomitobacter indipagum]
MVQYKFINNSLILMGKWNNDNLINLIDIINHADEKISEVQIDGEVSLNVEYIVDKYNNNKSDRKKRISLKYADINADDKKEDLFITKIIRMQIQFLKRMKLNSAQKEAFRDYIVYDFAELGMNSLLLVAAMCSVLGMAIVLEGYAQLYYLGVESFTMHFFVSFIFREMIPIMSSILIASKCVTSITSKLSAQKINSELKMLSFMNINENIVLKPKWIACMIIMPLMNVYGLIFSLASGSIAYSFLSNSNIIFALNHMISSFNMTNFLISQTKSLVFGWWIGLVMCSAGILYDYGIKNLGKAVVKSVVYSISGIIVFDMIVMFLCTKMGI